ncbi:hypothetical protein GGP57_002177 [Salinibacter ruber]|uniref:hypothetical protein n=1 Tax=Salinibacter ruber TaxID=146919 RepID=UPI0021684743|nr:hypothetical protein [Salinibacter ruber]MCS3634844.1 hypothetical protein [Salinibacter ruber]MCS3714681.1 hypothetical protein [Salinibacter ruber]
MYWLYLGLYQWLLGGLMLGALAIEWGFTVFDLLETDIYRGTSLGLPLLFAWLESRSENTESEPTTNS